MVLDEELTESLEGNVPKGLVFKLYAKWNPLEYDYQVEYYLEKLDGTYELEETLDLKGTYGEVVNAELKTYTGFSLNENSSNNTTTIKDEDNDVLKMYYDRNTYNIIFDEDGGEALTDLSLKYGENVDLPTPTRLGYEFVGWENAPTTMPASDVNVKAKWTAIEVDYKVEIYKENADDDGYTLAFEETKEHLLVAP